MTRVTTFLTPSIVLSFGKWLETFLTPSIVLSFGKWSEATPLLLIDNGYSLKNKNKNKKMTETRESYKLIQWKIWFVEGN